eukprot:1440363-Pyramimonas_sp.AAC.2
MVWTHVGNILGLRQWDTPPRNHRTSQVGAVCLRLNNRRPKLKDIYRYINKRFLISYYSDRPTVR